MEVSELLFKYADEHGLLSTKQDIIAFNKWMEDNDIDMEDVENN